MQKLLIEKENCTNIYIKSLFEHEHICTNDSDFYEPYFRLFFSPTYINSKRSTSLIIIKDLFCINCIFNKEVCLPMCPLECNRTEYKAIMSFNELNGDFYLETLKERKSLLADFSNPTEITQEIAKESFVTVNIFYDSLSYSVSTESPQMDVISLLANIGGNLSLFLGVSVFSFFEIVEVLIEIYFIKTNSKN